MIVAIIDYGSGNLRSATKAFERAITEAGLAATVVLTRDPEIVASANRIVLPGVGAFGDCRRGLAALPGMTEVLDRVVGAEGRPFLGICVGMQLLATAGYEHGSHPGLGWIAGDVVPLQPSDPRCKIPHMGWNELEIRAVRHPVLAGIGSGDHAYFVHGYHFRVADPAHLLAVVDYGGSIAAVVGRDNLVGTQFHPEKSQSVGLRLITNFLKWER